VIIVEAVGPTAERVDQLRQAAVSQIAHTLQQIQTQWGADPGLLVASTEAPDTAETYFVAGNRVRALGMTAALGIGVTVGVVLILESRARRKSLGPEAVPDTEFVVLDDRHASVR
jgi:hypothetical protein